MRKIILSEALLIVLLVLSGIIMAVVSAGFIVHTVTGPQGAVGPKGDSGPAGIQGLKGDNGITGAIGPQGLKGDTGLTGTTGAQGPKGDTGATGPAGTNGVNGLAGAMGATGNPGTNGATWQSGVGAPASNLGNNGDYYLNTINDDVYSKASGSWIISTNIKGAIGATGLTGPQGPKGDIGATGLAGPTGAIGPSGVIVSYNDTYAHSFISLSTSYKTIANISLTAPQNGYIILNVNAMMMINGGSTIAVLGLGTTHDAYPNLTNTFAGTTGDDSTTTYWPVTLQAVVPITTGNNYNFYANACLTSAMQSADLYYIYMTGIFYPA